MIMRRQPDGSYSEVNEIRTKDGSIVGKVLGKSSELYYARGILKTATSVPVSLQTVGSDITTYRINGNIYQATTPQPTSPVPVQGVGNKTKNLLSWDSDLHVAGGNITNQKEEYLISSVIETRGITSLYFSGDNTLMNTGIYRVAKSDTPFVVGKAERYYTDFKGGVYDVSDCNYLLVTASVFDLPLGNIELIKDTYMCNEGVEPFPYAPYGYEIPIICRGKNLFDISTVIKGYRILWASGALYKDESAVISDYIPVNASSSYYSNQSVYVSAYDANKAYIGVYANGVWTKTTGRTTNSFITPENCSFIRIFTYSSFGTSFRSDLQLELGNTATSYVPYREPVPTLVYTDKELYKDDYVSRIESASTLHRGWGIRVFDGTENWDRYSMSEIFGARLSASDIQRSTRNGCYCTHYKGIYTPSGAKESGICVGANDLNIYIVSANVDNLDDFKAFLASEYAKGSPVTVYYPLKTASDTAIELDTLPTFDGGTIVEVDTDIQPSSVEITYKEKKM